VFEKRAIRAMIVGLPTWQGSQSPGLGRRSGHGLVLGSAGTKPQQPRETRGARTNAGVGKPTANGRFSIPNF
jgi:hypothetical protein